MERKFTELLNKEGYSFQKYCAQKIKESGWSIGAEEFPISENESFDIKTTLREFETALRIAVVECKLRDPERKYWIFYKRDLTKDSEPFVVHVHFLSTRMRRFPWRDEVLQGVGEVLDEPKLGYPACHTMGVELYKDVGGKWRKNSEIIRSACLTVAKGINYLFRAEAERLYKTAGIGLKRLEKEKRRFGFDYITGGDLIPVVITTAPLYSYKFNPAQMNIKDFKVSYETEDYQEEEWLIYEFPLPAQLQYFGDEIFSLTEENRYAKMHIFIVNGRYITRFFKQLTESFHIGPEKSRRTISMQFMKKYSPKKTRRHI